MEKHIYWHSTVAHCTPQIFIRNANQPIRCCAVCTKQGVRVQVLWGLQLEKPKKDACYSTMSLFKLWRLRMNSSFSFSAIYEPCISTPITKHPSVVRKNTIIANMSIQLRTYSCRQELHLGAAIYNMTTKFYSCTRFMACHLIGHPLFHVPDLNLELYNSFMQGFWS